MAGSLYLGGQKVCPAIVVGGGEDSGAVSRYVVNNGVAEIRTEIGEDAFKGITEISDYALYYAFFESGYGESGFSGEISFPDLVTIGFYGLSNAFANNKDITSVDFSKVTEIKNNGMSYAFDQCENIESVDFSSLVTIGNNALDDAFRTCFSITSIDFSSLTTIGNRGLVNAFPGTSITSIRFPKLTTVGDSGFMYAFGSCYDLSSIYFNSITVSHSYMFRSMFNTYTAQDSGRCTVHFPSNMQEEISGLVGYPNFGGNSSVITLAFDLPATE